MKYMTELLFDVLCHFTAPCPDGMIQVGTTCYIPVNDTETPKKTYPDAKKV